MAHELARQLPDVRSVEFENAFYADEGDWIESLSVASTTPFDPESVVATTQRAELLHQQQVSTGSTDRYVYRLTVVANEPYPFLLGVVLREEAVPNRLVLRRARCDGVVTVTEWSAFRSLADRIQERFGQFELLSVNRVDTTGEPLGSGQLSRVLASELSEEQLLVLETAYSMGYFDVPRTASADDIAAELDIAQSTLSERLRVAEKQLFELVFSSADAPSSVEPVEQ